MTANTVFDSQVQTVYLLLSSAHSNAVITPILQVVKVAQPYAVSYAGSLCLPIRMRVRPNLSSGRTRSPTSKLGGHATRPLSVGSFQVRFVQRWLVSFFIPRSQLQSTDLTSVMPVRPILDHNLYMDHALLILGLRLCRCIGHSAILPTREACGMTMMSRLRHPLIATVFPATGLNRSDAANHLYL